MPLRCRRPDLYLPASSPSVSPAAARRNGDFNCLVATCIGEEGLDIPQVDLIVCFDATSSPTRAVQRVGRTGRHRQGRVVFILAAGAEEEQYSRNKQVGGTRESEGRGGEQARRRARLGLPPVAGGRVGHGALQGSKPSSCGFKPCCAPHPWLLPSYSSARCACARACARVFSRFFPHLDPDGVLTFVLDLK